VKEDTPAYNLKAVIHETGLTAATLRAWERRYEISHPQRSPGGHRLYTHAEIEMLKWLVARQAEGLSISRAVDLWRSLEKTARDPFQQASVPPTEKTAGSMLDQLRNSWLAGCLAFDETTAEMALSQALAIATPGAVCAGLLQKGLAELGEGWYRGTVSVQQEHFASALTMRRLNALLTAAPAPTRDGRLLAACPPGEEHDLALLIMTFILRWRGWDVVYLGANVPLAQLDATLQATAPQLVLSTSQTLPGAAALRELAGMVNAQAVPLAYGGGIFNHIPGLAGQIPGYFLGRELGAVPGVVEQLINFPPMLPTSRPLPPACSAALAGYKEKEALIVRSVSAAMENSKIAPRHLEEANLNFTKAISAALALGDIHFLDYSAGWLNGFLENRGLPPAHAGEYYMTYRTAVQMHLGSQAAPILDWLVKVGTAAA